MSLNVVIYLSDNTGHQFTVPNGRNVTAAQYLQHMINILQLPDALAKKCFSIWLKSPLLDVQLKPHHIPFRMVKQWLMLVERFSMESDEEKTQDEPALLFRRNAFLTKDEEIQITDESVLSVLLLEARANIRSGVFPCDPEDIEQLGALMCVNSDKETIKENLQSFVPSHMARPRRSFLMRQASMEDRIVESAKKAAKETTLDPTLESMKICWQLPYYGSVLFNGYVEKAQNNTLSSWFQAQSQMLVKVAINTDGLWIIDKEKKHVLIGLLHDDYNWEMTTATNKDEEEEGEEEEELPSLFLEFDDEKTKTNKLLQILSKEAPMMNSMIETCITMLREKEQIQRAQQLAGNTDESNGLNGKTVAARTSSGSTRVRPLFARQHSVTSSRPDKLSLTKFSDAEENTAVSKASPTSPAKPSSISIKKNFYKKIGNRNRTETAETAPEQDGLL